ncbi:MAG: hypothetical protein LBG80_05810, partial [Bacteroidales bacterium]|nr:hypothetical protein [Bacteroidales bacterium]
MKKRMVIIVLLGGTLFVSAQKNTWTIGLYSGLQGQINTLINQEYYRTSLFSAENGEIKRFVIDKWNPTLVRITHTFSH